MNDDEMREVVKECGLDWHRGYMPLFDSDPTNRYAVLIEAVVAAERQRMLSMPNLMHACDLLGVSADGTHCEILRRALYRA